MAGVSHREANQVMRPCAASRAEPKLAQCRHGAIGDRSIRSMPLPVTNQNFISDLDAAKSFFIAANTESDIQKKQALATLALAAAQIATAEATWLKSSH